MTIKGNAHCYARRFGQELDAASAATDPVVKTIPLNLAVRYATLHERSVPPHGGPVDGPAV